MRILRNKKGYSEAELMMVFALLALFGILCFTLIQAGSGAYKRMSENRSSKSYARVTLSYIENRVRQGDTVDAVNIVTSPLNEDEKALVISGITDIKGEDLWIMRRGEELVEYYVQEGEEVQEDNYLKIGNISGFDVNKEGDSSFRLEVMYTVDGKSESQIRVITLRSYGGGQ